MYTQQVAKLGTSGFVDVLRCESLASPARCHFDDLCIRALINELCLSTRVQTGADHSRFPSACVIFTKQLCLPPKSFQSAACPARIVFPGQLSDN